MKIDVIIPSNNKKEINGFISSFSKLTFFRKFCQLVIIGNGSLQKKDIEFTNSLSIKFIRVDEDYTNKLIPFAKLRAKGMIESDSDYFLFMDDDNRFPEGCDAYFIGCVQFLQDNPICSILQADKTRQKRQGIYYKSDGFYWTGYGIFMKNVIQDYSKALEFFGCCEETLFAYEVLDVYGLSYTIYGNPKQRNTY